MYSYDSNSVSIKNSGKVYEVEVNESTSGLDFKNKIYEITNIPVSRQKILIKGGKVDDSKAIVEQVASQKQPIMVLGNPDAAMPVKPTEKQVFLEDLNPNLINKVSNEPSGLINLGNTCYLNSSLQALYQIEDISSRVNEYKSPNGINSTSNESLTASLRATFQQMQKKQEKVNPTLFLTLFRNVFPQFAEQDHGFYKQQDAEEAFLQLLTILDQTLKVGDYFRLSYKSEQKCLALPDEETKIEYDDSLKLNCHIDIKTNFLRDGILGGLKETIEKYNSTLQSNTEYEVSRTITRLPKYLTVHFMRFFWRRDTQKKSKILRRVQFPFELDLSEMLDASIKSDKVSIRDKIRQIEKDQEELIRDFKKTKKSSSLNPMEQEEEDELKIESIRTKFRDELSSALPGVSLDTTTENPSSVYQLAAVITHAGSSADSGHYQAYVRDPKDLDGARWWKFNDDKVSEVSKEKIETLAGGGEADSALILLYKGVGL